MTFPSVSYIRQALLYNKETGNLYWRKRPQKHFKDRRACNSWNARYAGTEAFTSLNNHGYFHGALGNRSYTAHRVIWKLVTGKEPPPIIDHRDRNAKNNAWKNLRVATQSQNNINSVVRQGVCFDRSRGKWMAYVKINRKNIFLGYRGTKLAARRIRVAAAKQYFGEFAP